MKGGCSQRELARATEQEGVLPFGSEARLFLNSHGMCHLALFSGEELSMFYRWMRSKKLRASHHELLAIHCNHPTICGERERDGLRSPHPVEIQADASCMDPRGVHCGSSSMSKQPRILHIGTQNHSMVPREGECLVR